jgi:hypothetical protein
MREMIWIGGSERKKRDRVSREAVERIARHEPFRRAVLNQVSAKIAASRQFGVRDGTGRLVWTKDDLPMRKRGGGIAVVAGSKRADLTG